MDSSSPPPSCTTQPGCPCPTCWAAWMSSAPVSRARLSLSPDSNAARMTSAGSGQPSGTPVAHYDPGSSSWRTSQASLLPMMGVSSAPSSATLPHSGTLRNGAVWARPTLEPRMGGSGGGAWPTPTVCGNNNRKGASATSGDGLSTVAKGFASGIWPTPVATCATAGFQEEDGQRGIRLHQRAAEWAAGAWPTPTARDGKDGACLHANVPTNYLMGRVTPRWASTHGDLLTRAGMTPEDIGPLSPCFAEWLLGWPIGLTGVAPLGTEWTHWRQEWRSRFWALVRGFGG